jgi:hypothetical protein
MSLSEEGQIPLQIITRTASSRYHPAPYGANFSLKSRRRDTMPGNVPLGAVSGKGRHGVPVIGHDDWETRIWQMTLISRMVSLKSRMSLNVR